MTAQAPAPPGTAGNQAARPPSGLRHFLPGARWGLAAALATAWCAALLPSSPQALTPWALLRIPAELVVVGALLLVLPDRGGRWLAAVAGVLMGLLAVVAVADLGFRAALDRPFDPLSDWFYLGPGLGVLGDSIGRPVAVIAAVVAAILLVALVLLVPLSMLRIQRCARDHRTATRRTLAVLAVLWTGAAVTGLAVPAGNELAAHDGFTRAVAHLDGVRSGLADQRIFAAAAASADPVAATPADHLLAGLRGKDVLIVFVESYGRVAVQGSAFSGRVDDVLDTGSGRLAAAGFGARSAFLTSPTFGGISWLAHSTLQSGLWVDTQRRYDEVVHSGRSTLADAFHRAGWRTVASIPSNRHAWPEGSGFYHYDKIYDAGTVGYAGPSFSYAAMPDQYTLSAFQGYELSRPGHAPVMGEIDLVSSHTPWAPLPTMVPWTNVGDGSVFAGMPAKGLIPDQVWQDGDRVRAEYGHSIEYSLRTLISFITTYGSDNLVVLMLGDHQPATVVSGDHPGHDVPVTLIAHDPAVLHRISAWNWQSGLRPDAEAPVWPMSEFRDRFVTAYRR